MDYYKGTTGTESIQVWQVEGLSGQNYGFLVPKSTPNLVQLLKGHWLKEVPHYLPLFF